MDKATITKFLIGFAAGVAAPLVVDAIKEYRKKQKAASQPQVPSNTDHSFVAWTGDDNFFEIEGDRNVATNPHMRLVPLSSKENMLNYPKFKKYTPFNVSPAKRIIVKR
jgi:hypothetical protein